MSPILSLILGPDARDVGISNISFTVRDIAAIEPPSTPVAPIPLPAAGWLLLASLGAMVGLGRRRAGARPHAIALAGEPATICAESKSSGSGR